MSLFLKEIQSLQKKAADDIYSEVKKGLLSQIETYPLESSYNITGHWDNLLASYIIKCLISDGLKATIESLKGRDCQETIITISIPDFEK